VEAKKLLFYYLNMLWFSKKKKTYLGIDIGASTVKLVELEKDENRYILKNYGIYPLKIYSKQLGLEVNRFANEEIAEIIRRIIKESKIEAKETFFSIPVYSSFSTLIDFPAMPKKELASAVAFEAKKYVPVPIADVTLGWAVVNPLNNQMTDTQVLLVAVLKEAVNSFSQIAKLSGLKLSSLEVETFSLSRSLVGNDKSGIVLIDSGARSSNISIIDGGDIRVIYNFEVGGMRLTSEIAQHQSISQDEAEKVKIEKWFQQPDDFAKNALGNFLSSVIGKVRTITDSYQKKYNRKLEKCILAGGSMQIPGAVDFFSKNLNMEVSLGNPFARLVYPEELKPILKDLSPMLAVATGLAMR
jgi:type IV pilus assembly protein PilM